MEKKKIFLSEDEIPRQWYNINADIKMNPPLGPDGNPISPDMLAPVFPMNMVEQEVSAERWIDIPEQWSELMPLKRHWIHLREYIINTRVSALPEVTNPIRLWLRHITIRNSALRS
jgi:predicted alternative tryptophan synthase beta-subunit